MRDYQELKAELLAIAGILEKYPAELKQRVFELLTATFLGVPVTEPCQESSKERPATQAEAADSTSVPPVAQVGQQKKNRRPTKESYQLDRHLNLRGNGNELPSFRDFFEQKRPKTAAEFNAVSVYYLEKLLGMQAVTLNHVFTCYKEVGRRPPEAFKQSFIDTKNKQGYIDFTPESNVCIPHRGQTFVEHDLPRAEKPKQTKSGK